MSLQAWPCPTNRHHGLPIASHIIAVLYCMFNLFLRPIVLQGCMAGPPLVNPELPNLDSTRLVFVFD